MASAANFSKCPAIAADPNENPKGPKCAQNTCVRRCNDGFVPEKPKKVVPNRNKRAFFGHLLDK